jgi:hypothetical protein
MNRIAGLRHYLAPLLAKAPPGGETESALFEEGPERVYLRAADPDFSSLAMRSDTQPKAAE